MSVEFSGEALESAVQSLDDFCCVMKDELSRQRLRTRYCVEVLTAFSSVCDSASSWPTGIEFFGSSSLGNFFSDFCCEYKRSVSLRRQMSEEENRLESGRLIGTGTVNSRLNEVKRHLSREPPALQESLERDSNFCPVFSMYEHNFDRRFFDCDVPAIDGRFIGHFTSRLSLCNGASGISRFLRRTLSELEGLIPKLLVSRSRAFASHEMMNLVREFPERCVVEGSEEYVRVESLVRVLEAKFGASVVLSSLSNVIEMCGAFVSQLNSFVEHFERRSIECSELEAQLEALKLRMNILKSVYSAIGSIRGFDTKIRADFSACVNAVNAKRSSLSIDSDASSLNDLCHDLDHYVRVLESLEAKSENHLKDLERISEHLRTNVRVPDSRLVRSEVVVEKQKEVQNLMEKLVQAVESRSNRISSIRVAASDALSRMSRLRSGSANPNSIVDVARSSLLSGASEVQWREQVLERLEELANEKRKRLSTLKSRTEKLRRASGM